MNEVAVEGMTLEIVDGAPTPVSGVITIIGQSSTINKAQGKGAYLDGLQIQITNITSSPATVPDPGPISATINSSVSKMKENGVLFLINGDTTDIIDATPKVPAPPNPPTDYPVTFKVKITDANQEPWKGK